MSANPGKRRSREGADRKMLVRGCVLVALLLAVILSVWFVRLPPGTAVAQVSDLGESPPSDVFSPAHRSLGEAVRHFLGIRPDPVQPISFSHDMHVNDVDLECSFCHDGVTIGPMAGIPSISTCMLCHTAVATDRESVQAMVSDYWDRGQEPPWQRVYGWLEEDHVRFNHAPHVLNGVECSTCHGNVPEMTVAEPVIEHTMGFCVSCHEQSGASNDCVVCHY